MILPFTVLRRLDCVLEPTKSAVLAENEKRKQANINPEPFLLKKSGQLFFNTSPLNMKKLMGDQDHLRENFIKYIESFSPPSANSSSRSSTTPRSTGWPRPGCSISSRKSSPISTCILRRSAMPRWGARSRS